MSLELYCSPAKSSVVDHDAVAVYNLPKFVQVEVRFIGVLVVGHAHGGGSEAHRMKLRNAGPNH